MSQLVNFSSVIHKMKVIMLMLLVKNTKVVYLQKFINYYIDNNESKINQWKSYIIRILTILYSESLENFQVWIFLLFTKNINCLD